MPIKKRGLLVLFSLIISLAYISTSSDQFDVLDFYGNEREWGRIEL